MQRFESSRGGIIAWRQSTQEAELPGTVRPRRGWMLYTRGFGRNAISARLPAGAVTTLALSASPLALSGTLTPSGDIDYQLPFALTASALAVSGAVSVSGDLSITDEIRLTLSASPLALAGALAVAGDLDYVVPTLVLSASPLALSGAVLVTGDPAAVVPFALTASPITLTGAVDVTGEIGVGTRFDITADPIVVGGSLGVSGEIVASFTVPQPLSAAPTGRRVQTSGGRMNVQTTRRPTHRGGTR